MRRTTLNAHYTHARYTELIWDALGQLGFTQGRVLEPGCGSGNFIGLAPDGAAMTGVERDPVTAAIAAYLYPQADIRAESFADTRIPAGYYDAAVGNVPFGKFKLSDPAHNPGRRLSIHNHFIVKSLELTRPGGMAALLTSRYTMDSRNPEARRRIAALGDLVAAIRLPTSAHRQAAGTDVVTDLLILRRREPGQPGEPYGWELAPEADLPGGPARVNEYFTAYPEFVLGEMRTGGGAHGENDVIVAGPPDAASALAGALQTAVTRARASGLTFTSRPETAGPEPLRPLAPSDDRIDGLIQAHPDGTFTRLASGALRPYEPPGAQARELRQLIGLRDTVLALLRAEAASPDHTEEINGLRAELNAGYQDYLDRYGPVRRFTWAASGRIDPQTGGKAQSKRRPPQGGFRNDPLYALVYALEETYDPATKTAVRADIFTQRVVVPETPMLGADTADEALAICLNSYGEVRLGEITRLLGTASEAGARAELGRLVFDEPGTGRLVWAPLYLSGDVRAKLAAAEGAAAADPRFEANVAALREVVPRDLGPAEIEAQLGAGWIAPHYVQQFLRETLGDDSVAVERNRSRKWKVSGGNRKSVAATSTWGTRDACAQDLAQRLLTGTAEQITVKYEADGLKYTDHEATEAARQKARELADRFSIWVWEDADRTRDLARVYNDRYNAVVPVSFDGVRLFTPGLSAALTLRAHQPPAIARVIYQGSAGLVHDTGAGKTLETIIGVRERQRLGLSHKPCFVVQKNKVGDFRDEFLRAYPDARLLVADTKDLTGAKRREFIARCATGNPTAIIMSREAFRSIPVSAERIAAFLKEEEIALEIAIEDAQKSGEDPRTIKQIEAELENTKERRKEQVAKIGQDRGLCYEDTGIDYLVLDEARAYRKGPIISSLPGMADPGSARSLDLLLKLGYHHDLHGETRVALADATPFTNKISEIYTWLRYLHYDIEPFDDWTRTFGKMAVAYEMLPGGDFKAKARLREIINAVDLHLWLREANDFKLKDSLDLKLPEMAAGKPQIVQVPASGELLAYAEDIRWRYEHLPKGPPQKGEDNHLKVQGDAIKAALDLRLVGRFTSQPQKVDVTADVVYDKWLKHRDDVYKRADDTDHPVRGSLILVFASLGTPGRTRKREEGEEPGPYDTWDFYTQLRANLADRGMPARLVRFMHEADNEQRLEELFHGARNGEVHVLVGSTEKLGVGVNVQDRCVGMVQVTAPWNWDEPHQELGRVERQGNQNDQFFCIRIVTTPSADAIKWERARQKEQSFRALMSGKIEGRTIRIPDDDLSSAEMMAAASGDMRLLERAELEGTLSRLDRLRRAWAQQQTALGYTIRNAEDQVAGKKRAIAMIDTALSRRTDTRGDAFTMTVAGRRYAKRAEAAERLREILREQVAAVPRGHVERGVALGKIGGFTLTATLAPQFANSITLTLEGIPDHPSPLVLNHRELPEKAGIVTRLENRLTGLEQSRSDAEAAIGHLDSEIAEARASIGGAFPQQDKYDQASARLKALETDLVGASRAPAEHGEAGEGATPEPASPAVGSRQGPGGSPASPEGHDTAPQAPAAEQAHPLPPDTARPPVPAQPDAEAGPSGQDAVAAVDDSRAQQQQAVNPDIAEERAALPLGQPGDGRPPAHEAAAEPDSPGRYSGRISVSLGSGPPTVSGTSFQDDPAELREALRANGFTWRKQRQAWEYTGRGTGPLEAVAAIREVLARLDREPVTATAKEFPPTPQQQAILDAFLQGKDIAVQALAGTGKTTTLVLLARALMDRSPDTQVVYTAFNADIVADARRGRFGRNVTAMTMHSIAKQALLQTSYAGKVNSGDRGARWPEQWASVLEIADVNEPGSDPVPAEAVARLVIATVRKFRESADDEPARQHLPGHLSAAAGSPLARAVLSHARRAWADIAGPGNAALFAAGRALRVDHDDYLKVWALSRPRINAGVIFFDEAQDVNAVMRRVILDQPAQTVVVGDSHQSIYGFRGAIDALKDWPADVVLPLTQSWRFGPAAAEFGNLFLRSLGSGLLLEGNPALATRLGRAYEPDAILCRTNAAAVAEVFAGLECGTRVALAGGGQAIREIAKAARDLQAGRGTKHPDLSRFADWDEVRHYAQHEEDGKSLQVFVRLVDRHGPDGLIDMIGRLTPEGDAKNPPQLTISTAHKAKGRQWPRVRIAGDFRGPATDPETGEVTWPAPEERRLAYVAATRAQELLETGSLSWIYDYPQVKAHDQGKAPERAAAPLLEPALAAPAGARESTPLQPPSSPSTATAIGQISPVNNSDLAVALSRLTGFTRLLTRAGAPAPGGSRSRRGDGEPGAGASQAMDCDADGIEITISGPGFQRHGRLTWPQVTSWIDAGVTPARLGIIITADRLSTFCRTRHDELIAAGKCDPDAAVRELDQIRDDTIGLVIDAALHTRGAAAPVPPARPGNPAYYTAAMITRPDEAASREENTVLERLNRLRTDIRELQPITPGEIRATIRRWIGDDLPDYARALGNPEKMRAWISRQVSGPASRPSRVSYETPGVPGGRWYGASPEGLLTAIGNDDRAETLIPWEEIPAWVQPGITSSMLGRLAAAAGARRALFSRRLTAAVHPHANLQAPTDQEEEQAGRRLREAIADAWAAVAAEGPPSSAQLEGARRAYRDTGPVQEALLDDPSRGFSHDDAAAQTSAAGSAVGQPDPAETGPLPHADATPGEATSAGSSAHPDRQASTPGLVRASGGSMHGPAAEPAPLPPPAGSLDIGDVLLGLSRLSAFVIADLFGVIDASRSLDPVFRRLAPHSGEREPGEPDAGARETVTVEPAGLRIHVTTRHGSREGLVAWPEIADLLRPGLTPSRRQILAQAAATGLRFAAANVSFRAVGEGSLAAAAEEELRVLANAALTGILDDARAASSGQPPQPAGNGTGALTRISELAAALPGRRPQPRTPVSQVKAGDIIGHPGYKFQPFRVSAPPRHHDAEVEITGHLTTPSDGEPAGQITFTLPATRHPDPVVSLIPLPQRSLRSPVRAAGAEGGTRHGQDIGRGTADPQAGRGQRPSEPSRSAGPADMAAAGAEDTAPAAPASGGPANPGPPPDDTSPTEENTMPTEPAETMHAPEAASHIPAVAPEAAPASPAAVSGLAGRPSAGSGTRQAGTEAQPGDGTDLVSELDRVLNAIIERRRGAGRQGDRAHDDFTDIRAAFTLLRNALNISGPASLVMGYNPRPGAAAPGPAGSGRAAPEPARSPDPGPSGFDDIRSAFADLRSILDLPAGGRHARGSALPPGPSATRLLDRAAEEAQACAKWYRDTPEWRRITTIGRAARELIGTIKEAAGDYWTEIRQDIRVRGFARTLAARVCLAVSGTAHVLATTLERAGCGNTRTWRAAWGLHRATATVADRIMRYTPPQDPDRMNDARRIIGDLGARQRSSQAPAHAAGGAGPEPAHALDPVKLARDSFTARAPHPVAPLPEPDRRPASQARQRTHRM